MIDCLILGDDTASALTNYINGCAAITAVGASSNTFISLYGNAGLIRTPWDTVIISLGVYDHPDARGTKKALQDLRNSVNAKMVYWILPPEYHMDIRSAVHDVAMGRRDGLIDVLGWSRYGPTVYGYREIEKKIRESNDLYETYKDKFKPK